MRGAPLAIAAGVAALASLALAATSPPPAAGPVAPDAFPPGAGRATFVRVCSGCHSPAVAAQQRLSPAGWTDLVGQMAGFGASGTDAEFAEITAYLARSYPDKPPP